MVILLDHANEIILKVNKLTETYYYIGLMQPSGASITYSGLGMTQSNSLSPAEAPNQWESPSL